MHIRPNAVLVALARRFTKQRLAAGAHRESVVGPIALDEIAPAAPVAPADSPPAAEPQETP